MRVNQVKRTLAAGGTVVGTLVFEFGTTGIGRIVHNAGADFVIYDTEHSGWSIETIRMLSATTAPTGTAPFVRVAASEYHLIAGTLDAGAMGLMLPMVESKAQAEEIVRYAKYPPVGRRGSAFGLAHDDYTGGDIGAKMRSANDEGLLIAMIETAAGVEAADEIMAVPGIDLVWVGHFDLTASLGIPAQFDHPLYNAAIERIIEVAAARNMPLGVAVSSVADGEYWMARGFRAISFGFDMALYHSALSQGIGALRAK